MRFQYTDSGVLEVLGYDFTGIYYLNCPLFCLILRNWFPIEYAAQNVLDYGDHLSGRLHPHYR